jgi:DNA repair photolyase
MSRGGRRTSTSLIADPGKIQKKIARLYETGKINTDIIDALLLAKMPVHFGGMSDPFATPEISERTLKILQILNEIDLPIVLSTKNTTPLIKDSIFFRISKLKNLVVQISISLINQVYSSMLEPYVPTPKERIKAIEFLTKQGVYTIVRLQPLFANTLDETKDVLIPALGEAGAKHIILEFLKLPVETNLGRTEEIFKVLNWDGATYYKKMHAERNGREWMLPAQIKWELLQPLINQIHNYGMTYGAGDYGLNHLGDTDCCCGIDKIEGFSNWNHNNFSNWIKNNRTNVIIFNDKIQEVMPSQGIGMYINSHSRIAGEQTLFNYLKNKWNRPGTTNAPDSYLGVQWKGDFDEKGNCVYYKNI